MPLLSDRIRKEQERQAYPGDGGGEPSVAITSLGGGVEQSSLPESSLDIVPETEPAETDFETAREEVPAFPQGTDFSHLKTAIRDELMMAYSGHRDALLCALHDCFESVLSGVSFQWGDIFKEPLSSKLYIVDSAFNRPTKWPDEAYQKSRVSTFFALATILRYSPHSLVVHLSSLEKLQRWYQKRGVGTIPLTVWMIAQVNQCDPLLNFEPLIPAHSMEMLLRLRFPASQEVSASKEATRVARIYKELKDVALEGKGKGERKIKGAQHSEEAIQQMFAVCLRLAREEGNPDLANEAASIAILSLKKKVGRWDSEQQFLFEKVVCWEHWYDICKENVQVSVALLKTLVENWKDHQIRPFIGHMFTLSLRIAGEEGDPVLLTKEATAVAIWSLNKFSVCWKLWDRLCEEDLEASKQFIRQIFTFSLRLAGKGNPDVAKEAAAISIWSLTENVVVCWKHWDNIYDENIEASAALLEMLVEKWKDYSVKLLSSPSDTLTLSETIKSFRVKNEQAIPERGAYACFYKVSDDGSFHKVADKSCKVILRRLISTRIMTAAVTAGVRVFGFF
ncbi:unnamed protein product [Thlaspi arvense]|uniref:Uncharacterized protein n=1 Tax=Thlaspi arvense TaxID=13288 RepID=A0AAU9RE31_THLAR|nr:unnamed protein product [Thlaspi arvense]